MQSGTIIEEIHKIRENYAKQFNYNLSEIFDDLKEQEKVCFSSYKTKNLV